eukprot:EG_transcript_14101
MRRDEGLWRAAPTLPHIASLVRCRRDAPPCQTSKSPCSPGHHIKPYSSQRQTNHYNCVRGPDVCFVPFTMGLHPLQGIFGGRLLPLHRPSGEGPGPLAGAPSCAP